MYVKPYRWPSDEAERRAKPQLQKILPNCFDQSTDPSSDRLESSEYTTSSELSVHPVKPARTLTPGPSAEESTIELADPETAQDLRTKSFVENLEPSKTQAVTEPLETILSKYEGFMAERNKSNTGIPSLEQLPSLCLAAAQADNAMPTNNPFRLEETSLQISTNGPPCAKSENRKRRYKKKSSRTNRNSQYRVHKKCASAKNSQGYEFLHLAAVKKTAQGTLEYEVLWAPSFVPVEYLQGEQAFAEAEDLVVKEFGRHTWDEEMKKF